MRFEQWLANREMQLPSNLPDDDRAAPTPLEAVPLLSDEDRYAIRRLDIILGTTVFSEYLDRTYIDASGVTQPVSSLFVQAARDEMDFAGLAARLTPMYENGTLVQGADWWENLGASYASSTRLAGGGGGGGGGPTTQEQIDSVYAVVRDRAAQLGLSYTDDDLVEIATVAVNGDWNDAQVIDRLLTNYDYGTIGEGTITGMADSVKSLYRSYLLDIDDATAMQLAQKIAIGESTAEGVTSSVKRLAANTFTWASPFIDDGLTLVDALSPLRNTIATTLELDPQEVDIRDDKFLNMMFVDGEGGSRLATSREVRNAARAMPEWGQTDAARTASSQMVAAIGNIFGRRGF